jgi:hypothetical protein
MATATSVLIPHFILFISKQFVGRCDSRLRIGRLRGQKQVSSRSQIQGEHLSPQSPRATVSTVSGLTQMASKWMFLQQSFHPGQTISLEGFPPVYLVTPDSLTSSSFSFSSREWW